MFEKYFLHYIGVFIKHAINVFFDIYLIHSPFKFRGDVDAVNGKVIKTQSIDYVLLMSTLKFKNISNFQRVIDVGSGKGRCCAYIGKFFPDKEVLGIELNPLVANFSVEIFKNNFNNVTIVSGDVLACDDCFFIENSLYILFNPFDSDLFVEFLRKINKKSTVVYINASENHLDTLSKNGFIFKKIILNKWYFDIEHKNVVFIEIDGGIC